MGNKKANTPPTPTNATRQAPAPAVAAPRPVDPQLERGTESMKNLQQLGKNPQALAALQKIFGGGAPAGMPGPPPAVTGPATGSESILFAAVGNCVNSITRASERTAVDLVKEQEKTAKLEAELAAFRKQEEDQKIQKLASDQTKRQFSSVIEGALRIATEQGGNRALADTMIHLAQVAEITLNPEHIDTLTGAASPKEAQQN